MAGMTKFWDWVSTKRSSPYYVNSRHSCSEWREFRLSRGCINAQNAVSLRAFAVCQMMSDSLSFLIFCRAKLLVSSEKPPVISAENRKGCTASSRIIWI